jgi:hypothetical protein
MLLGCRLENRADCIVQAGLAEFSDHSYFIAVDTLRAYGEWVKAAWQLPVSVHAGGAEVAPETGCSMDELVAPICSGMAMSHCSRTKAVAVWWESLRHLCAAARGSKVYRAPPTR